MATAEKNWMFVRIFLAVATVTGAYLAWISVSGAAVAGCGPDSGCHSVLASRWAKWFGIPVSLFAVPAYVILFIATFQIPSGPDTAARGDIARRRSAWIVLHAGALITAGAAVWFTALQIWVVKALCPFCMTAHVAALLAAILILRRTPGSGKGATRKSRQSQVHLAASAKWKSALAAATLLAGLVAGQILQEEPSIELTALDDGPPANQPVLGVSPAAGQSNSPGSTLATPAEAEATPPPEARQVRLFNGNIVLDPAALPVLGQPTAPHPIVSLFDYTCDHCRETHHSIQSALRRFGDQICFISLPVPLDSNCNRLIKTTRKAHQNACRYAQLGLAVFRAQPEKFEAFDDWIFQTESVPDVTAARARAVELVGEEALNEALNDPWIQTRINESIDIYEGNYRQHRKGSLPQLILGNQLAAGSIPDPGILDRMIRRTFQIEPVTQPAPR